MRLIVLCAPATWRIGSENDSQADAGMHARCAPRRPPRARSSRARQRPASACSTRRSSRRSPRVAAWSPSCLRSAAALARSAPSSSSARCFARAAAARRRSLCTRAAAAVASWSSSCVCAAAAASRWAGYAPTRAAGEQLGTQRGEAAAAQRAADGALAAAGERLQRIEEQLGTLPARLILAWLPLGQHQRAISCTGFANTG